MENKNYVYTLQKEDLKGNVLSKRKRKIVRFRDNLKVGSTYIHLPELSGIYRVISVEVEDDIII